MSKFTDIAAMLAHREARQADAIARTYAGTDRTWAQLAQHVEDHRLSLTHRGMLAHSRHLGASQGYGPGSRVPVAMPLFHVGGTSTALVALTAGARVFLMRTPDPAAALAMLAMLAAERITHTFRGGRDFHDGPQEAATCRRESGGGRHHSCIGRKGRHEPVHS